MFDRRHHTGGNIYCERIEGVNVHRYGAHIFHTSNEKVWKFVNSLVPFNRYTNSPVANYQGNDVVNYTEREVPYTRIIEHKHFEAFGADVDKNPKTVISREYSTEWKQGMEPYYPVNDERNQSLYAKYKALADAEQHVVFAGRLAEYKYYDMAPVIERAFEVEIL